MLNRAAYGRRGVVEVGVGVLTVQAVKATAERQPRRGHRQKQRQEQTVPDCPTVTGRILHRVTSPRRHRTLTVIGRYPGWWTSDIGGNLEANAG